MKLFLDANVLVSALNREYPVFSYSSRILSLSNSSRYKLYTSPLCLGIAFYYAQKKNRSTARNKIALLASHLHVTGMNQQTVTACIRNKQIHDFEDGLQYYSALESGCTAIISEDGGDFYFSEIKVLRSREFMERYVF